jgi:hypothetical protein
LAVKQTSRRRDGRRRDIWRPSETIIRVARLMEAQISETRACLEMKRFSACGNVGRADCDWIGPSARSLLCYSSRSRVASQLAQPFVATRNCAVLFVGATSSLHPCTSLTTHSRTRSSHCTIAYIRQASPRDAWCCQPRAYSPTQNPDLNRTSIRSIRICSTLLLLHMGYSVDHHLHNCKSATSLATFLPLETAQAPSTPPSSDSHGPAMQLHPRRTGRP